MKKLLKFKVVDRTEDIPETILVRKKIYKEIEKEVDACDICGKAEQDIPICLGCGKVVCYLCNRDHIYLDQIQLWVGEQEESGDNYFTPGSDDFDTEHFYLCKSCQENPPDKIAFMRKQKDIEKLEDDIKKITQEMIKEARGVKKL
jgi:hypothetical protein